MSAHSQILCFKHCERSIFCRNIPEQCPLCHVDLSNCSVQPFVLPYCCANAKENPPAIVLKPTVGRFIDYVVTEDLHIGIVDSLGNLYEFDQRGITINDYTKWLDCVIINVVPESWYNHWDEIIGNFINDIKWSACNYNSNNMNCYDFIIEFLRQLNYTDLHYVDKEHICKQLLLPKLSYTLRYLSIYRNLIDKPYYIV